MKIITVADTYFKALPEQSSELKEKGLPNQLISVKRGQSFSIVDHRPWAGNVASANDDHTFFQLAEALPEQKGIRWFAHGMHTQIEGTEPHNNPQDEPAALPPDDKAETDYGPKITIPGISRLVGIYEPVYFEPTVCNFTWAELTKGGQRIPIDSTVTVRLVRLARYMDKVRKFLGSKPVRITSAYRDPVTNRRVGGARSSRHMAGDAVDFRVDGLGVIEVFRKLKGYHKSGGLAVGNGFVHLDMRVGAPARWTYPGGPRVALW
jgi:hypothetical protein